MVVVTAAVIQKDGRILIARRTDKILGGLWEFPGGKIEAGESPEQCLERELFEELGVKVTVGNHVVTNVHEYEHVTVKLISYLVEHVEGDFELRDHDRIEWIRPSEFSKYDMAPADMPTVEKLISRRNSNVQS